MWFPISVINRYIFIQSAPSQGISPHKLCDLEFDLRSLKVKANAINGAIGLFIFDFPLVSNINDISCLPTTFLCLSHRLPVTATRKNFLPSFIIRPKFHYLSKFYSGLLIWKGL